MIERNTFGCFATTYCSSMITSINNTSKSMLSNRNLTLFLKISLISALCLLRLNSFNSVLHDLETRPYIMATKTSHSTELILAKLSSANFSVTFKWPSLRSPIRTQLAVDPIFLLNEVALALRLSCLIL